MDWLEEALHISNLRIAMEGYNQTSAQNTEINEQNQYQAILEKISAPCLIASLDGQIYAANNEIAELLKFGFQEIRQRKISEIFASQNHRVDDPRSDFFSRLIENYVGVTTCHLIANFNDGTKIVVEARIEKIILLNRTLLLVSVNEIIG